MITGAHVILYARHAEQTRAFLRDVLGLPHVDAGRGWLIFALPPAEIAAHPTDAPVPDGQPPCELYLMCDDLDRTVAKLTAKGVEFVGPVSRQPWGHLITLKVPGAGSIGLYQPLHPVAAR
jgi:catechol 2,3-dioxygenase-like lactoylglutathione lyase family enzyme